MVNLLICGDLHLRKAAPKMRIDDFFETQKNKLNFIFKTAKEHECTGIIFPGDVFDKADSSYSLIKFAIEQFNEYTGDCFFVFGNHDLRYHTSDQKNTPLGVLVASMKNHAGVLNSIPLQLNNWSLFGCSWNQELPSNSELKKHRPSIIVMHRPVALKTTPWPQENFITARDLLKKSVADIFITGDNHEQFILEKQGRFVINMGSVMRTNIDQFQHKPAVALLQLQEKPLVKEIFIPIKKKVFDREQAEIVKEAEIQKNERLKFYTDSMKKEFNAELSFMDNLGALSVKAKKGVKLIIDEALL